MGPKSASNPAGGFPHQLHAEGRGHSSCLLESPGEVEQSCPQRWLQHDEHGSERAQPRRVRVGRGPGQQADALPGQFLHGPKVNSRRSWTDPSLMPCLWGGLAGCPGPSCASLNLLHIKAPATCPRLTRSNITISPLGDVFPTAVRMFAGAPPSLPPL